MVNDIITNNRCSGRYNGLGIIQRNGCRYLQKIKWVNQNKDGK